jgi:hypothetical protein
MKLLYVLLFAVTTLSCSKSKDKGPLKAIPTLTSIGSFNISLDASKSTGDITQYGWQLDTQSPTTSAVTYAPSSSHKGSDFVILTATVKKVGTYTFGLTVYDAAGNTDYQLVNVEVK